MRLNRRIHLTISGNQKLGEMMMKDFIKDNWWFALLWPVSIGFMSVPWIMQNDMVFMIYSTIPLLLLQVVAIGLFFAIPGVLLEDWRWHYKDKGETK